MKNYLLLTASAVLVLSSCSNNEIVENKELKNAEPTKMTFATYIPGMTRAVYEAEEAEEAELQASGFQLITSLKENDEEFIAPMMQYNSTNNVYEPVDGVVLEWPTKADSVISFYAAYAPDAAFIDGAFDEAGSWKVVEGEYNGVTGEQDLMVATKQTSLAESNGTVRLDFEHILSQVEVRVVGTTEGYDYYTHVMFKAPKSNTYSFEDKSFVVNAPDDIIDMQDYNLDGLSICGDAPYGDFQTAVGESSALGKQVVLENNYKDDDVYAKLMVVPGTCTMDVFYKVALTNPDLTAAQLNDIDLYQNSEEISFDVEAGKRNLVIIRLNPVTRTMNFSVQVTGWTDGETIEPEI